MRKLYGTTPPGDSFTELMPSVGDPDFTIDSQNNDRFWADQTDVPEAELDPDGDHDEAGSGR